MLLSVKKYPISLLLSHMSMFFFSRGHHLSLSEPGVIKIQQILSVLTMVTYGQPDPTLLTSVHNKTCCAEQFYFFLSLSGMAYNSSDCKRVTLSESTV